VRGRLRWFLLAAVVVVLGVAGAAAWYVFGDDAPAKPQLSEPRSAAAAGGDPAGTWRVVPGEDVYVGYRIKELFGGATIKKDAVGRTPDVTGSLTITADAVTAAEVTADLTTLDSNRAARDSYLRNNALETERFSDATFELTGPIEVPTELAPGTDVEVQARGRLTLHGETKPVTLTLDARFDGDAIEVAGTAPVVLADYAIEAPDTAVAAVDDEGSLELHLRFERA
jgi:polyisoprenoid-binding protein YceI